MLRSLLYPALAAGLATGLVLASPFVSLAPANAQALNQMQTIAPPTLTLSASADLQIAPEFATIRSGVVSRADSAEQAVRENGNAMSGVFAALRREGIADSDMQTANLSVSPVYTNPRYDSGEQRRIIGYEARNTVSAKVRDLTDVGEVLDAMVRAGANNIEGITFGAEDTADAMDEARRMAVARLLEKAELFADAAGQNLCGIRRLAENFSRPQFANAVATRSFAEDSATPIAAGSLTLTATVNADFCIEGD